MQNKSMAPLIYSRSCPGKADVAVSCSFYLFIFVTLGLDVG